MNGCATPSLDTLRAAMRKRERERLLSKGVGVLAGYYSLTFKMLA
jgi:hypothetical protein